MAPSKKGKKVVNQEELRRLMREKQRQSSEKKRVESPFAKYNSLGHLSCVLCNVQVKSDLLWTTHVLGKQHKEKVADVKGGKDLPQSQAVKRKTAEADEVCFKKPRPILNANQSTSGLPADFFEKSSAPPKAAPAKASNLLAGAYDDDDDDDDDDEDDEKPKPTNASTGQSGSAEASELPTDFFDSSIPSVPAISHSGSIQKAETPEKEKTEKDKAAEAIPEGFFDDPVTDAKVRNVEAPKDQMDKEWEEFQKEMRQVNTKSEAIVAEEDEEGRLERQIDEIDEQIACYRRVELLRDKRDLAKSKMQTKHVEQMETDVSMEEEMEMEEEEDEDELLGILSQDWRAKGALS